jgi:hypothetical protein
LAKAYLNIVQLSRRSGAVGGAITKQLKPGVDEAKLSAVIPIFQVFQTAGKAEHR